MLSPAALSNLTLPKAPPLSGERWLGTPPLDAEMLKGRCAVVLFWALGCEASWVRLRQLEELHARHRDTIAIVAVHSPRFDYERDVDLVEATIAQRGLRVPVLHDPALETWSRYGPTGRPTVIVSNPRRRVLGAMFGTDESAMTALADIVAQQALLADDTVAPLPDLIPPPSPNTVERLHGPTSLARLLDGGIAVIDRGNDRLVVLDIEGERAAVRHVFGGIRGAGSIATRRDGSLSISMPDRGVVESIDLATKDRSTIAEGLVRPMGLIEDADGSLVVCDAGADAILRISEERMGPIATPVSQPLAAIRIPSGLVFITASTGSMCLLDDDGKVRIINSGRTPGLLDGPAHKAMFQRPAGLATLDNDRVAVADHGNSRIRIMAERRVTTVPVAGLSHPEGLLYLGDDQLLCSDTMNHRLVLVDLESHRAAELKISGLPV